MVRELRSLAVFCGSHAGRDPAYAEAAATFGVLLARRGVRLIYGGGRVGLMGVLADAVLAAGGEVVGVIPRFLVDREVGHGGVTELVLVESMHERKAAIERRADGFVALPGGVGTLEEIAEIWTWVLLGLHDKPVGILNAGGYYDPLVEFLDRAASEGFLSRAHRRLLLVEGDAERLLDRFAAAPPPPAAKWTAGEAGEPPDGVARRG